MKRIKQRFTTIFLTLLCVTVFAQDNRTVQFIKGKIIDGSTKEPIAYTNIGIEGTFYGTASDADGNFELKIPQEQQNSQIFFSAVGYKNKVSLATDLLNTDFNLIKLSAQTYSIGDIDINAQSKVLLRILRTASENVSKNFRSNPTTLMCLYENEKKLEGKIRTRNATIRIDDITSYSNPSKSDSYKNRNYKFINVQKNFESYSLKDGATSLDEILELDFARSLSSILNPNFINKFKLNMEEETVINNNAVWIIGFSQSVPTFDGSGDFYASSYEGKVYINKNNYSVLKIESWIKSPKQNSAGRGLALASDAKDYLADVAYDFTVLYNDTGVEFISLNKNYKVNGRATSEKIQLIVNEVNPISESRITTRDYFEGE